MLYYVIMKVKHHSGKNTIVESNSGISMKLFWFKVSLDDNSDRTSIYIIVTCLSCHSLCLESYSCPILILFSYSSSTKTDTHFFSKWNCSDYWRFVYFSVNKMHSFFSSWRLSWSCIGNWICTWSSMSCFIRCTEETVGWSQTNTTTDLWQRTLSYLYLSMRSQVNFHNWQYLRANFFVV